MARFQILTLDGGGVRGSFALGVIAELEGVLGHSITECFDMLAGTSTGAIAAAGLSLGLSGEDLIRFYRQHVAKIFQPQEPYRAKGWTRPIFPLVRWTFRRRTGSQFEDLLRAKYCPHALEQALSNVFGDRILGDIHSHRLVVPVVDLTLGQTRVFRTPHLPRGMSYANERLVDVLMAATAAPTYFPCLIGEAAGVVVERTTRKGKPHAKYGSAHDFRRAFGLRWLKLVKTPVLMQLMRRADTKTTLKYYVGQDVQDAAEQLQSAYQANAKKGTIPVTKADFVDTGDSGKEANSLKTSSFPGSPE